MRFKPQEPPREFQVAKDSSPGGRVVIKDCGRMTLESDEQVTLVTEAGGEYDIARKSWGFYATPSLNSRLSRFGLRAVLMKCPEVNNPEAKYFVYFVERGKEPEFHRYIDGRGYTVVSWLDTTEVLNELDRRVNGQGS